jgi:asparagine N-glycosylation enzyme membrane subunit Stt3
MDLEAAQRKEKLMNFINKKSNWLAYLLLAAIVFLAVWIRTRNVYGLIDVSTGAATLGPDLDPFLFLRWSQYIIEHGSLFANDLMRYIPLGYDTTGEYLLHPYMMAWFHNIFSGMFSWSTTQSAIYYPVFMFGLTVIAFFLFVRKTFSTFTTPKRSNAISLVASVFFSIIPSFLPRTIAGIPEKESAAFLFLFLAFYFFINSWETNSKNRRIVFAALAGISTAAMGFIWGGYVFIFYILSTTLMILFLLGAMHKKHLMTIGIWLLSSFLVMLLFFGRYNVRTLLVSATTASAILVFITAVFHYFVFTPYKDKITSKVKILNKIPPRVASLIIVVLFVLIVGTIIFGSDFAWGNITNIYFNLVKPAQSRLINTVAENRQPYFGEWASSFGPQLGRIYIGFSLILISSIILFYQLSLRIANKKESIVLTSAYTLMVLTTIFTRLSSSSILNGENTLSLLLYALGLIVFVYVGARHAIKVHKRKEVKIFSNMPIGIVMALIFLVISFISARGIIRLVMMLVPPGAIMLGFITVYALGNLRSRRSENVIKIIVSILIIMAIIFSAYSYYSMSKATAQQYIPSPYTQQWQKAMGWVRENTPLNAVFGHWWDYGYWVQSMGERATVLDGGNAISYWNHLMGRHALTGSNEKDALEFLYVHNTTHFLIDSTDIGKYGAFSSIGSDKNYDRRSWIPTLLKDPAQTGERKNSTIFFYSGGTAIDQDIRYTLNGTELFLPEGKAYLAGIVVTVDSTDNVKEVFGIYYLQEKTYQIPLRYYWDKKVGLVDQGTGLDAGVLIYPRVTVNSQGGGDIDPRGAMLYLSQRTVHSQLAKLYLFSQPSTTFTLAHSQPDEIVENLKSQNIDVGEFIFFNEFRGPIKIWSIKYPANIEFKEEYLETEYPQELLFA